MNVSLPKFALDEGLELGQLLKGSVLHVNEYYDNDDDHFDTTKTDTTKDFFGEPIQDFKLLAEKMINIDQNGFVKKKVLEEGGGMNPDVNNTVFIALSGYFEGIDEPFDVKSVRKPLEVDLSNHGLLPGLDIAIRSMLVGELSIFLFSHEVMYGEFGVPPKIKPKAQCVFYIKLVKSVITPKKGKINFSEPNIFDRVHKEALLLYSSGITLFKMNNFPQAVRMFKKAEYMLHRCRLADDKEELIQEKLLKKVYTNLSVCYNKLNQPYKTCIACNELARLRALWNNGKALFQNAKALRMIGQYDQAEKRLKQALKLHPNRKEMLDEIELLNNSRKSCNQTMLTKEMIVNSSRGDVSDNFKKEVDNLIENFKQNVNLSKLTLPDNLSSNEIAYVKEACIRQNLFFSKVPKEVLEATLGDSNERVLDSTFALDKENLIACFSESILDDEDRLDKSFG